MISSTNYALRRSPDWAEIGSEVWRDLVFGGIFCARIFVVLIGCATLLIGGTLAASGDARGRLVEQTIRHVTHMSPAVLVSNLGFTVADAEEEDPAIAGARGRGLVDDLASAHAMVSLDPQQKRVASYLARRYRVADEAVGMVVSAAYETGRSLGLDPLLILAVTAIESSMNPFAQSGAGAQGLMQVMTRVHSDKFEAHGGHFAALDPVANLRVGSEILKEYVLRGGSVERGLQLYVGAGAQDGDSGYAARVLAERGRLKSAAGNRNV
jgi:hypothetical protein